MRSPSIRSRIFVGMMVGVVGFLAIAWVVFDRIIEGFVAAEITQSLERGRTAHDRYALTRDALLADKVRTLSEAPSLRAVLNTPDVDSETVTHTLTTMSETAGAPLLLVSDARGRLLAGGPTEETWLLGRVGVDDLLAGGEFNGFWELDGQVHHIAASAVTLGETVIGILALGRPLDEAFAAELKSSTAHDVTLWHSGRLLAFAWDAMLDGSNFIPAGVGVAVEKDPTQRRISVDEREFLVSAIPLDSGPTMVILSRSLDDLIAPLVSERRIITLTGLAVSLLAFFVSTRIARRIGRPISKLTQAADRMAGGDLTVSVDIETNDELGRLARSFNTMRRQIDGLLRAVQDKARAAEQASEAKSQFLATISHELRTPLNGVLGFSELLLTEDLPGELREHAQAVHDSGRTLLSTIEDVLAYSEVDTEVDADDCPFHLRSIVRDACEAVRNQAESKKLTLNWHTSPDAPEVLVGSAGRYRQVLGYYLDNAVKFTSNGGVDVQVTVTELGDGNVRVETSVLDTGIGVPESARERIFKPFIQVDSRHERSYGGSGLGLAISRELAKRLGGECGIEDRTGSGSRFWFTAEFRIPSEDEETRFHFTEPAERPEPVQQPRPAPVEELDDVEPVRPRSNPSTREGPETGRRDQRILVAEDNPINQRMVTIMLERAGWSYSVAKNGVEAVELFDNEEFDLVLMDLQMPKMNGFEATRRIRARERATGTHVPVIALTANTFDSDRRASFESGMDDFVSKPFEATRLVALMDHWIGTDEPA